MVKYKEQKLWLYKITCKAYKDWQEDTVFFHVSDDGMSNPFYCIGCRSEDTGLYKFVRDKLHEVEEVGTFTTTQLAALMNAEIPE